MNHYTNQSAISWDEDSSHVDSNTSAVSLQPTIPNPSPTLSDKKSVWSPLSKGKIVPVNGEVELTEREQSTLKLETRSLSAGKTNVLSYGNLLMNDYTTKSATNWDEDTIHVDHNTSAVSLPSSTLNDSRSVWSRQSKRTIVPVNSAFELTEGEQSITTLEDGSRSARKTNFFRRAGANICTVTCKTFFRGLLIGLLLAGLVLAIVLTIWLKTATQKTSTTQFASTSTATTSTSTTSTSSTATSTTSTTASTTTTATTTTTTTTTTSTSTTTTTTATTTITTSTSSSSTSTTSTTTTSTTTTTTTTTTITTSTSTSSTSTTATTTTSVTTTTSTSTSTTTTTAFPCISSLAGATTLLHLANAPSQSSYIQYTYIYTAITTSTRLTLAFRMDSNNWSLDTLSAKSTGTSTELLTNEDFESGSGSGWLSCNPYNAASNGFVQSNYFTAYSGYDYWKDGSVGAADYLWQYFPTVAGMNYTISFYLKGDGGTPNSADVYIGL